MRCWFSKHGKEHYIYAATDSFSAEFRPNFEKRYGQYLKSCFFFFFIEQRSKASLQYAREKSTKPCKSPHLTLAMFSEVTVIAIF